MRSRTVAIDKLTSSDIAAWSECAARSLEPNPFFEPAGLLPAVEYLGEADEPVLVLVERNGTVECCLPLGKVGIDEEARAEGASRSSLTTMIAPAALALGTPLVTEQGGGEAMACAVGELVREALRRGAELVDMEWVGCAGPVARLLHDAAAEHGVPLVAFDSWERAFLRQRAGEEAYWLANIGKHRRRTLRQQRNHLDLAAGGRSDVRVRTDRDAVADFLALEAAGWKGHEPGGLAFQRSEAGESFFAAVCAHYLDEGRMWFTSLEGDGQTIAMLCCVRAGPGTFAYRTAYDEGWARFGPGVQIFLAAMEHFDADTDAAWLDGCAARDNEHLLGLLPDRKLLATCMLRPHEL